MQQVQLEPVAAEDVAAFRQMVEAYWREIMPAADVVQNHVCRAAYFERRYSFEGKAGQPHWAVAGGQRVGFLMANVAEAERQAVVNDFYVLPEERRQGYGSAMVRALHEHLDERSVQQIDLDVRHDNPGALAFWQAQGFRIALYRLRQYRDPKEGRSYVGALSGDFVRRERGIEND